MKITSYLFAGLLSLWYCSISQAITIDVPGVAATIAAAVDMAVDGDEIVITKGVYNENNIAVNKRVTIRSSGNTKDIKQTILGGNNETIFHVTADSKITGLTFVEAKKPIVIRSRCDIDKCVFYDNNSDVISFESEGYGSVEYCIIEGAGDDGIDIDSEVGNITIRRNRILNCGDDGIEIRLYSTQNTMNYVIRDNVISYCEEDGIQLIDYSDESDRTFSICGNMITNIDMAGIGCMPDGETRENYGGSNMVEKASVYNNVIAYCTVGITGAAGLRVYDNFMCYNLNGNIKNPNGASVGYNILN